MGRVSVRIEFFWRDGIVGETSGGSGAGNSNQKGAMKTKWINVAGVSMLLAAGCVSHEETVYRDVERKPVEFENDAAARVFYETLMNNRSPGERTESKTEFSLPVVFDHKKKVVSGPNAAFNEAVMTCDTNKDGKVTVQEARIYAELKKRKG
jgi:hypothetical protein